MGVSKKEAFDQRQNRLADLAKAFAHPARIAILEFLTRTDTCICNDIVQNVPLAQSTISQHLKELRRIGIVHAREDGKKMCYGINRDVWDELNESLGGFFRKDPCS